MAPRTRTRASRPAPPSRLILDAGAVIAAAAGREATLALLATAYRRDADVLVPAVVVAETVRGHGPRDASVNRALRSASEITPTTEDRARIAGALLAAAKSDATVDALVVAEAVARGGGMILTGDPDDLRRLASGHPEVVIAPL